MAHRSGVMPPGATRFAAQSAIDLVQPYDFLLGHRAHVAPHPLGALRRLGERRQNGTVEDLARTTRTRALHYCPSCPAHVLHRTGVTGPVDENVALHLPWLVAGLPLNEKDSAIVDEGGRPARAGVRENAPLEFDAARACSKGLGNIVLAHSSLPLELTSPAEEKPVEGSVVGQLAKGADSIHLVPSLLLPRACPQATCHG